MTAKLVGGALVMIISLLTARTFIETEERKLSDTEVFIKLITYIKDQIDCYAMPIDRILRSSSDIISAIYDGAAPTEFETTLQNGHYTVSDETKQTLMEFSSMLGKSYREVQIKLCSKTLSELEAQKNAILNALPSKKKTAMAICLAVGGIAVIALM